MQYLLDKNVVRHAITGFRDGLKRPLLPLESGALAFWQAAEMHAAKVFISEASFHVLQRRLHYDEAIVFLDFVEVLSPTRYHTRWARRIRETSKLSREDAAMIALATARAFMPVWVPLLTHGCPKKGAGCSLYSQM